MEDENLVVLVAKRLGQILINSLRLLAGVLKLIDLSVRQIAFIAFVLATGFLLLFLRQTFFDLAPSIASSANAYADGINAAIGAIDGLMLVVESIVSVFSLILGDGPTFKVLGFVSADAVQQFATEVPRVCAPVNSAGAVLDVLIRPAASPSVCPTVRYLYPTWVYPVLWPLVDAFSLSYDPVPFGNNCQCNTVCSNQDACVVLGSGYLVLEILLPLLIFGLLASSLLGPISGLIATALRLALELVEETVEFIVDQFIAPIAKRVVP